MKTQLIGVAIVVLTLGSAIALSKDVLPDYSAEESIDLAVESSGKQLASSIIKIEINVRAQYQFAPLLSRLLEAEKTTVNRKEILEFLDALWHPSRNREQWNGKQCSVVFRLTLENGSVAYFHVYLRNGKFPLITPYTGYDTASYENSSIIDYVLKLGVMLPENDR